jgi:hypothetical protein
MFQPPCHNDRGAILTEWMSCIQLHGREHPAFAVVRPAFGQSRDRAGAQRVGVSPIAAQRRPLGYLLRDIRTAAGDRFR